MKRQRGETHGRSEGKHESSKHESSKRESTRHESAKHEPGKHSSSSHHSSHRPSSSSYHSSASQPSSSSRHSSSSSHHNSSSHHSSASACAHHASSSSSSSRHLSQSQPHASTAHRDKRPKPSHAQTATELKLDWKKQQSQLICDIRYSNSLPWPPLDPKLLHIALPQDRLTRYCATSLQRAVKAPILCERNLGIPIDMIDQEEYRPGPARPMDPGDAALFFKDQFERTSSGLEVRIKSRGGHLQDRHLSWLEKPMHLQNNLYDNWEKKRDFQFQKDQRMANSIVKSKENMTRDDQMAIIEKTFDFAQQAPVHPINPDLKLVKSMEIFPHQSLGHEGFTWITFDSAPADLLKANTDAPEAKQVYSSFLRSYTGSHHAFYIPDPSNPPTGSKRHFKWLREYFKNPTPTVNDLNNFYFTVDGDAVVYNRFQHRLSLRIRTQTANDPHADEEIVSRPRYATLDTNDPPLHPEIADIFGDSDDDVFADAPVAQTVEDTGATEGSGEDFKHGGQEEQQTGTETQEEHGKAEGGELAKIEEEDEEMTKAEPEDEDQPEETQETGAEGEVQAEENGVEVQQGEIEAQQEGEVEAQQEGEAETQEGEAETQQEGEVEAQQEGEAETQQEGEAEAQQEGEAEAEQEGEAEAQEGEAEAQEGEAEAQEGEAEAKTQQEGEAEAEIQQDGEGEAEIQQEGEAETQEGEAEAQQDDGDMQQEHESESVQETEQQEAEQQEGESEQQQEVQEEVSEEQSEEMTEEQAAEQETQLEETVEDAAMEPSEDAAEGEDAYMEP